MAQGLCVDVFKRVVSSLTPSLSVPDDVAVTFREDSAGKLSVEFTVSQYVEDTKQGSAGVLSQTMLTTLNAAVTSGAFKTALNVVGALLSCPALVAATPKAVGAVNFQAKVIDFRHRTVDPYFKIEYDDAVAAVDAKANASYVAVLGGNGVDTGACDDWDLFLSHGLDVPIEGITFALLTLDYGYSTDNNNGDITSTGQGVFTCRNVTTVTALVDALKSSTPYSMACGGNQWNTFYDSVQDAFNLCVNCGTLEKKNPVFSPTEALISPCSAAYITDPSYFSVLSAEYFIKDLSPDATITSVAPDRTALTLSVSLSFEGRVLCAAYPSSTAEPSRVAVRQAGAAGSVAAAPFELTVGISGLSPETEYVVYCLASDFEDHEASEEEMLATRVVASTSCCRQLAMDQTHASIFVYPSSAEAGRSEAVFTFSLDSAPLGATTATVTAAAVACYSGGPLPISAATLVPSTFTFSPTSASLAGNFLVRTASQGCYDLTVATSGATSYVSTTTRVSAIRTTVALAVPTLSKAIFTNDGLGIRVSFAGATDRGALVLSSVVSSFTCSEIFIFASASTASCQWEDAETLYVALKDTASSFAVVGGSFTLVADKLKAACEADVTCGFSAAQTVSLSKPAMPSLPAAALQYSRTVSKCADIKLDATKVTGRGRFPWAAFSWEVSSSTGNGVTTIQSLLASSYGPNSAVTIITVPNALLAVGEYSFLLSVTTQFGKSSFGYAAVTVAASEVLPSVTLSGPAAAFRHEAVTLVAEAGSQACGSARTTVGLTYAWFIYRGGVLSPALVPAGSTTPILKLAKYKLDASTSYIVKVVVTKTSSGLSNEASVTLDVGRAGAKAVLAGGSSSTLNEKDSRSIDGSGSFDLDFPAGKATLAYAWACAELSPAFGASCPVTFPSQSIITFNALDFAAAKSYTITLTVRNTLVTNSASAASTVVKVIGGLPVPTVSIKEVETKYNAGNKISLAGLVDTGYKSSQGVWSAVDTATGNALSLSAIAASDPSIDLSYGKTNFNLIIKASTLPPGGRYKFSLSAGYSAAGQAALAVAEVSVAVNAAPYGGSLALSPIEGTALATVFTFVAADWADPDLPLLFDFLYTTSTNINANGKYLAVGSTVPSVTSYVGAGKESLSYTVLCIVYVSDAYGTKGVGYTGITVVPDPDGGQGAYTSAQLLLNEYGGDAVALGQIVSSMVDTLLAADCSNAPDCDGLGREGCGTTAGTCGPCLEATPVGQFGDSNSACSAAGAAPRDGAAVLDLGASKECINACSEAGSCRLVGWGGAEVQTCDILDSACRAECVCDSGAYGSDCSMDAAALLLRVDTSALVCDTLAEIAALQIDSDGVEEGHVLAWAGMVSSILADMATVSDAAFATCAGVVRDVIAAYPGLAAGDGALPAVVLSLSGILGRGPSISNAVLSDVTASIEVLNTQRQAAVAAGEAALSVYTPNLRYFVVVDFLGDLTGNSTYGVAQSTLEQAAGVSVTALMLASDDAVNGTVRNTVHHVGISTWEILVNLGRAQGTNSSEVVLQTRFIADADSSADSFALSRTVVLLENREEVAYTEGTHEELLAYCHFTKNSRPYTLDATCPSGAHAAIVCPGNETMTHAYTCPYRFDKPQCLTWDGAAYVSNPSCSVTSFTGAATTCECTGLGGARRRLAAAAQSISFSSRSVVSLTPVTQSLIERSADRDTGALAKDSVILTALAALMLVAVMFGVFGVLWKRHKSTGAGAELARGPAAEMADVVTDFLALLAPDKIIHKDWYVRFKEKLGQKSYYFRLFCLQDLSGRAETWLVVIGFCLNFMFIHALLVIFVYPDDGTCEDFDSEESCLADDSLLVSSAPRCRWAGLSCELSPPLRSALELFVLILLASVASIPLHFLTRVMIRRLGQTKPFQGIFGKLEYGSRGKGGGKVYALGEDGPGARTGSDFEHLSPADKRKRSRKQKSMKGSGGSFDGTEGGGGGGGGDEVSPFSPGRSGEQGYNPFPSDRPVSRGGSEGSPLKEKPVLRTLDGEGAPLDGDMREMHCIEAYFKDMHIDDPSLEPAEGAVDDELEYVVTNAGQFVAQHVSEAALLTEASFQRHIYRDKLMLTTTGGQKVMSARSALLCQSSEHYLTQQVAESRYVAGKISAAVRASPLGDAAELADIYLFEQFLLHTLPAALVPFARHMFFGTQWSSRAESRGGVSACLRHVAAVLYLAYLLVEFVIIAYAGLTYGTLSSFTWVIAVAISIGCDVLVQAPFTVLVIEILFAKALMGELSKVYEQVYHRFGDIASRAVGYVSPRVNVIQHLNPACRSAREAQPASPMARFLLCLDDLDLPGRTAGDRSAGELLSKAFSSLAVGFLLLVLSLSPAAFQDVAIEGMTSGLAPGVVAVFYLLSQVSIFLPFAACFFLVLLLAVAMVSDKYSQLSAVSEGKSAHITPAASHGDGEYTQDDMKALRLLLLPQLDKLLASDSPASLSRANSMRSIKSAKMNRVRSTKIFPQTNDFGFIPYQDDGMSELTRDRDRPLDHSPPDRHGRPKPGSSGEDAVQPFGGSGGGGGSGKRGDGDGDGEESLMSTWPPQEGDGGSVVSFEPKLPPLGEGQGQGSVSGKSQGVSRGKSGKSQMQADEYKRYTKIIAVYLRDEVRRITFYILFYF
jgi:hypothetical protein